MTEAEWATRADATSMVWYLRTAHNATRTKVGRRKLRLFCCACARQVWELILQDESRATVEVCERFADGEVSAAELDAAWRRGLEARSAWQRQTGRYLGGDDAGVAVGYAAHPKQTEDELKRCIMHTCSARFHAARPNHTGPVPVVGNEYGDANRELTHILRDIFGNPFRPVAAERSWLTTDVRALARGIYEERAFDRMPILADALQDAGCANEDVLAHCRDAKQVHARGCWVVDLVLGRG